MSVSENREDFLHKALPVLPFLFLETLLLYKSHISASIFSIVL